MGIKTSMRELFVISGESTHTSLVLSTAPEDPSAAPTETTGEGSTSDKFFLVLDDAARETLLQCLEDRDPLHDTEKQLANNSLPESDESGPEADHAQADHAQEHASASQQDTGQEEGLEAETSGEEAGQSQEERPHREIDPKLTRPLSMRPREIQDRIRAGASVRELAEIMDVAESRVEPYAYPVLAEREGITEIAKRAYPIIDDKPSSETLYEVLAQAFASRNFKLSSAHWDSYRDESKQWIVTLSWHRGLSLITAQWTVHRQKTGHSTVEPNNAEAADLIDPNFVRPVRRLATITSLEPKFNPSADTADTDDDSETPTSLGNLTDLRRDSDFSHRSQPEDCPSEKQHPTPVPIDTAGKGGVGQEEADEDENQLDGDTQHAEEPFLLNPTAKDTTTRRRKKSAAPRWEDVLLGIRTNTKHSRK